MEKFMKLLSILLCCSFLCGCALGAGSGAMVGLDLAESLGDLFGTQGALFHTKKNFEQVKQATEKVIADLELALDKTEEREKNYIWYYCRAEKDDVKIYVYIKEISAIDNVIWVSEDEKGYQELVMGKIATELRMPLKRDGRLINPEVTHLIYQDYLKKYSQEQKQEQGNQEFQ